jgi:hypothetical protein
VVQSVCWAAAEAALRVAGCSRAQCRCQGARAQEKAACPPKPPNALHAAGPSARGLLCAQRASLGHISPSKPVWATFRPANLAPLPTIILAHSAHRSHSCPAHCSMARYQALARQPARQRHTPRTAAPRTSCTQCTTPSALRQPMPLAVRNGAHHTTVHAEAQSLPPSERATLVGRPRAQAAPGWPVPRPPAFGRTPASPPPPRRSPRGAQGPSTARRCPRSCPRHRRRPARPARGLSRSAA